MNKFNCSVGKKYRKKQEKFELKKFGSGFNLLNPIWWAKTVNEIFRFVVVIAIIFGIVFATGYWQGTRKKPVILGGYKDFVAYLERDGVEHKLELRDGALYLDNKVVRASDVPQLKPYGIKIRPKLFAGIGASGGEVGFGTEIAHYFKFNLDVFGTQKAAYFGISYDMELTEWMRNSSAGLAMGKAWDDYEDTRFLLYWSIKF